MKKEKKKTKLGFSKVEILGNTFKIIETDDASVLLDGRSIPLGKCIPRLHEIYIDSSQDKQEIMATFLHEVLHLIDWLSHNEEFTYNEETINVLARGLLTIRIG